MPLNKADTRARLIDPRLEAAHWGTDQISREHYYRRDVPYTPGRIVLRGTRSGRKQGRKVDYLLRYLGFPITVVEAKSEDESVQVIGLDDANSSIGAASSPGCARQTGNTASRWPTWSSSIPIRPAQNGWRCTVNGSSGDWLGNRQNLKRRAK